MVAGSRVEVAPFKEDPLDFVLWKPSDADTPGWESPWGRGRPGWHIECSAMAHELLGPSFDIHAGGLDLQFPHHENEIAQSRCAHPEGDFAQVWMHNEMLQVEGKKMSKSLGNFFTVRDLLAQGVSGQVIRFLLLQSHYSRPLDWTSEKVELARRELWELWQLSREQEATTPHPAVISALSDDLNVPQSLLEIRKLRNAVVHGIGAGGELRASLEFLGFFNFEPTVGTLGWGDRSDEANEAAKSLVRLWMKARAARDFGKADELKRDAESVGVELRVIGRGPAQQGEAYFTNAFDEVALFELMRRMPSDAPSE
jgi:cysteinyl-tRNA synthetase